PPPAPSAPAASAEPPVAAATGGGPVQIAQVPARESVQAGGIAPALNTAPMPDLTTKTTAAKRRTPGRAGDRIVINSNGNFNKPKPVQTAMAEPAPLATESIAQIAEQPA